MIEKYHRCLVEVKTQLPEIRRVAFNKERDGSAMMHGRREGVVHPKNTTWFLPLSLAA
ncbi:MAG TPA: hypothetical protein PLG94_04645 [Smithellaceae bacterium]|nr:hypothetical protein [Smithellaceae bacterium]